MRAAKLDLTMEKRAQFSKRVQWLDIDGNPVNLTGWTASWLVTKTQDDSEALFVFTESTGVTLAANGLIDIVIESDDVDSYDSIFNRAWHRLTLANGSAIPTRLFEGFLTYSR